MYPALCCSTTVLEWCYLGQGVGLGGEEVLVFVGKTDF